jgi:IS605 OrfB family transposase
VKRAVKLNICPTALKRSKLEEFSKSAVQLANLLLSKRKSRRMMELYHNEYSYCKKNTPFQNCVILDILRQVARKPASCKAVKNTTIKFNVGKSYAKFFKTKAFNFVELALYPKTRLAIPICNDRCYNRFQNLISNGWRCTTVGLSTQGYLIAYLNKEDAPPAPHRNILGVDVNSKCFAITVLSPEGKVLHQSYLGKDIWHKRKRIIARLSKLHSFANKGDSKAARYLRKLKHKEKNFVKNRLGEVVRDITNIALKFDADIAIEKLKRFSPKGKRFNREVFRIPFRKFKEIMQSRCFDKGIALKEINPYHTSKWCSHCGALAKAGHCSSNYSLFKCECGQVVNSDRKASLAIAVKSLLPRMMKHKDTNLVSIQLGSRRVPVNGLLCPDEAVEINAVHDVSTPMESHRL